MQMNVRHTNDCNHKHKNKMQTYSDLKCNENESLKKTKRTIFDVICDNCDYIESSSFGFAVLFPQKLRLYHLNSMLFTQCFRFYRFANK